MSDDTWQASDLVAPKDRGALPFAPWFPSPINSQAKAVFNDWDLKREVQEEKKRQEAKAKAQAIAQAHAQAKAQAQNAAAQQQASGAAGQGAGAPAPDQKLQLTEAEFKKVQADAFKLGVTKGREATLGQVANERTAEKALINEMLAQWRGFRASTASWVEPLKRLSLAIGAELARAHFTLHPQAVSDLIQAGAESIGETREKVAIQLNDADFKRLKNLEIDWPAGWQLVADNRLSVGSVRIRAGNAEVEDFMEHRLAVLAQQLLDPQLPAPDPDLFETFDSDPEPTPEVNESTPDQPEMADDSPNESGLPTQTTEHPETEATPASAHELGEQSEPVGQSAAADAAAVREQSASPQMPPSLGGSPAAANQTSQSEALATGSDDLAKADLEELSESPIGEEPATMAEQEPAMSRKPVEAAQTESAVNDDELPLDGVSHVQGNEVGAGVNDGLGALVETPPGPVMAASPESADVSKVSEVPEFEVQPQEETLHESGADELKDVSEPVQNDGHAVSDVPAPERTAANSELVDHEPRSESVGNKAEEVQPVFEDIELEPSQAALDQSGFKPNATLSRSAQDEQAEFHAVDGSAGSQSDTAQRPVGEKPEAA